MNKPMSYLAGRKNEVTVETHETWITFVQWSDGPGGKVSHETEEAAQDDIRRLRRLFRQQPLRLVHRTDVVTTSTYKAAQLRKLTDV